MKTTKLILATLLLTTSLFAQSPPTLINPVGSTATDPAGALAPDATTDEVLEALQSRGQNLKEFTADVALTDTDLTMGDTSKRTGKVSYQLKSDGTPRLHILFDKKTVGDKSPVDERREYLLDDGWAYDRDYHAKTETRYQITHPGEKMNLFQLGKGAFPLPIGQNKDDVHANFDVTKIPPAPGDPPSTLHLQLKPKPKTDFEKKFSTIDIWVDLNNKMPIRIATQDRNQTTQRQTDLQNLKVNPKPPLNDSDFALPPVDDQTWNRHDEPLP